MKYGFIFLCMWLLLIVWMSCGDNAPYTTSNESINETNDSLDTARSVTLDPALVVVDTPKFYLESDTLIGGYRFGMNIDQWNTNLAIHVKNGAPIELKQPNEILEGFTPITELGKSKDNQQYGISINGIFDFGHLIGVKYVFHLPTYLLYDWSQNIIKDKGLVYVAGEEIQPLNENSQNLYGFNYQVGQDYTDGSSFSDYVPNHQDESVLRTNVERNNKEFVALYEAENIYSVIECEIMSSILVTYDTRWEVNYDQSSGRKIEFYRHRIRDLGNETVGYGDLTIKVFSKSQAKINPEDYYNFEQREKLKKSKSNEEIVNRVLNKS